MVARPETGETKMYKPKGGGVANLQAALDAVKKHLEKRKKDEAVWSKRKDSGGNGGSGATGVPQKKSRL